MNEIIITPSILSGELKAPPSKSISHRAVICAAVSKGDCLINNIMPSDDVMATINGMKAMGSRLEIIGDKLFVTKCVRNEEAVINCRESGSTMRFLIPLAAALGIKTLFIGEGKLPERTIGIYDEALSEKGVIIISQGGFLPVEISGKMTGGEFRLKGDISSQFVSGLLLAAPLIEERVEIIIDGVQESLPYIDITIDIMKRFGVNVIRTESGYIVEEGERYESADYTIEGDYSQAAFWLVANELGSNINVTNLNADSVQGDRRIIDIISSLRESGDKEIIAHDIPDLVPILAVLAGAREGTTIITGAKRLKYKESDRLLSTSLMLETLGVDFTINDDGFTISGCQEFQGGIVDSFNDHRIAMAAAIAAIRCNRPLKIINHNCVSKSYVNFFEEYVRLSGRMR